MKFLTESIRGTLKSIRTYPIYTLSGTNLVKDLARLLNSRIGSILKPSILVTDVGDDSC